MSTRGTWAVVLYPASWTDGERCSARPLVGHPDSPLVALLDERAERPAHLTADPAEVGAREREAIRRLRGRAGRPRWEPCGLVEDAALLVRAGDAHTASDVLDRDVLREAADALWAEPIHVAIPGRRVLLAGTDPAAVLRACQVQLTRTPPAEALSRLVFEVRDGVLVGTSGAATSRALRPDAPPPARTRRPTGSTRRPARPAERLGPALALGLLLLTLAGLLAAARGWVLATPARGSVSPALHASPTPEPPR